MERLLRQDGEASLQDIQLFHKRVMQSQGINRATFLEHCMAMDVSVDGLQEAPKARRTLILVSVRLGGAIYVKKAFNPLMGVSAAKPTVDEILR